MVEPEPPANCTFGIIDAMLVNDLNEQLLYNSTSSHYQISALKYPVASFTYQLTLPSIGEVVVFNASESHDPDYSIETYTWDFGDGTTLDTSEPIVGHVYDMPGAYNVT